MKESVLLGHLGAGDHIVCNALVRALAVDGHKIVVLAKHHNVESCRFQWRDNPNIEVFGIADDAEAKEAAVKVEDHGIEVIRLGFFKPNDAFDIQHWDQEFYRQAGVPFEYCHNRFKVDRQPSRELIVTNDMTVAWPSDKTKPTRKPYAFVHDDPERGFAIKPEHLPKNLTIIRAKAMTGMMGGNPNIFDWWKICMDATEIHCMESVFAILVDHSPEIKAKRCVLHTYTRESIAPTYQMKWEVIQ